MLIDDLAELLNAICRPIGLIGEAITDRVCIATRLLTERFSTGNEQEMVQPLMTIAPLSEERLAETAQRVNEITKRYALSCPNVAELHLQQLPAMPHIRAVNQRLQFDVDASNEHDEAI